jgi:hypothetical protein
MRRYQNWGLMRRSTSGLVVIQKLAYPVQADLRDTNLLFWNDSRLTQYFCGHVGLLHPSYVVCLTRSLQSLPKRVLHTVWSSVSCFNFQYALVSLRPSSSCLHFLACLPVGFSKVFLRKMWPIQLVFFLFTVYRIFLSSVTLRNTSSFPTRSVRMIFSILLQHHISQLSTYFWSIFRAVLILAPHSAMLFTSLFRKFKSSFLLNVAGFNFTYTSCIIYYMLDKCFKYSTFYSCFLSLIICNGDGSREIFVTLAFSTFFSIHSIFQFHLIYQSRPVAPSFSLISSSRSSPYFAVRSSCAPVSKSPDSSREITSLAQNSRILLTDVVRLSLQLMLS